MALTNTDFGHEKIAEMMKRVGSVYFIGIGGVSMSCLALLCAERGYLVAGSDRTPSGITERLQEAGVRVFYGHRAEQIDGYGAVVFTLAIDEKNPEYEAAQKKGIPLISRADFLGYLMYDYRVRIGVSGMHGKSTVTAMIYAILSKAKTEPTVVSGAALSKTEGCYHAGKNDFFLYEACEYMGSFFSFYPTLAVILNMEMDHPDYFHSMEDVREAFRRSLKRLPTDGYAVLCADDDEVMRLKEDFDGKTMTFGLQENADVRAEQLKTENGYTRFLLTDKGKAVTEICLHVPGIHNVVDALAAASVALYLHISPAAIKEGLESFGGARRRMEYHTTLNGVAVYEDYAHHPTEIKASLQAAKMLCQKDVWCVFQSHTYSRTAELFDDFTNALTLADHPVILPIYAARETDTRGVSGELLANALPNGTFCSDYQSAAQYVMKNAKEGDLIIIMGAGDVFHVLEEMGIKTQN